MAISFPSFRSLRTRRSLHRQPSEPRARRRSASRGEQAPPVSQRPMSQRTDRTRTSRPATRPAKGERNEHSAAASRWPRRPAADPSPDDRWRPVARSNGGRSASRSSTGSPAGMGQPQPGRRHRRGASGWEQRFSVLTPPTLPAPSAKVLQVRLVIVWGVLLLAMVGLLLNLLRIQVLEAVELQERAKAQQVLYIDRMVPRRPIIDRNNTVLALDNPVYTLYAHPVMFKKVAIDEVAAKIAPLIRQTPADLRQRLLEGETGIRIVDELSEDVARQITEVGLDGLELVQSQQRLYPYEDLLAEVVGYVNVDREGQSGVEYMLQDQLQQPIDDMQITRSGDGSVIPVGLPSNFLQQQKDDLSLQLTLDYRLQWATRTALRQQIDRYSAKRGAVLVMDVQDGSILALASEPTYDPNRYYQAKPEQLRNWVLTDLYEPGSTFKPINVAIALQSGAIHPDDAFFDEGAIEIGGWPIQNSDFDYSGGRGTLSVSEILQYSSNVGMVHVMQTLQPGIYHGWLSRLALNKKTGIDLPSEAAGQMKSYRDFVNAAIEPATTAFGQGFSLTPIKLLQLHSMLANGGKMVTPHVVQGLTDPDGTFHWRPDRGTPPQIFSPETTRTVLEMMEQVVQLGTGKPAQIPGYRIAGKTGTAQKASEGGGYIEGARITSFVGIFPVEAPRYAVLAVVDEPQGEDAYGSTVAAPIVRSVMEALINLEHIPPSDTMTGGDDLDRHDLPGNYTTRKRQETEGEDADADAYDANTNDADAYDADAYGTDGLDDGVDHAPEWDEVPDAAAPLDEADLPPEEAWDDGASSPDGGVDASLEAEHGTGELPSP